MPIKDQEISDLNLLGFFETVISWQKKEKNQMRESNDAIQKIKDSVDIVKIIGKYLPLNNNMTCCPFHEDKTPSLSVWPEKQMFKCFGCGIKGDVIEFIRLYQKKSFKDALAELAKEAAAEIPDLSTDQIRKIEADLIYEERCPAAVESVYKAATRFYAKPPLPDKAMDYLIKVRNLSEDTITKFQIGFAKGGLYEFLDERCWFSLPECEKAGAVRYENGRVQEYFRDCITIPCFSNGQVVDITARGLGEQK